MSHDTKLLELPSLMEEMDQIAEQEEGRRRPGRVSAEPQWGEMSPLPPDPIEVPTLPPELVPSPLHPWLMDISTSASIPLEMVAAPAIVTASAIVGRNIGIRPEEYSDWLVVPNLWGAIVARPGLLKTPALAAATAPLGPLEKRAQETFEVDKINKGAHKKMLEARLSVLKRPKGPSIDETEVAEILREIQESEATERRYKTCDPTVEKLGELLRDNPRGLLLQRDELSGWIRTMDKPERAGEREFYLEAWNGTGSYTFDRIGRGTVHIPALCLSVIGGITPGALRAYIAEAVGQGAGADGLLQRLQLFVWPSGAAAFHKPTAWPDREAKEKAYGIYQNLDSLVPSAFGAQCDPYCPIPFCRFCRGAQGLFDEWRSNLESRLRSVEMDETPAFQSHLAKYRSLMPSLALLFDLIERLGGRGEELGAVSLQATRLAAAWCDFLEAHARKIYATELNPADSAARLLAKKIADGQVHDRMTVRDAYIPQWEGLRHANTVKAGLGLLANLGWLVVEEEDTGGRPREVIRLHPSLRKDAA